MFRIIFILLSLTIVLSCSSNKEKKDTSELWSKSMASQDIIKRSGTIFTSEAARKSGLTERDARTRLQTGGGLFGKKGISTDLLTQSSSGDSSRVAGIGMPINPYLWRASLESISFMPLSSADPFAGIIITDWYNDRTSSVDRCKVNIFVKGVELDTHNLKASIFCQELISSEWVDRSVDENNNMALENTILEKAIKLRLSSQ